jgi:flagellar motor switch protein FliG
MSITARHKKPGAFRKLVNSLETTPSDRRQKILDALKAEDKELAQHAEKSLFYFEDFLTTSDEMIREICQAMKSEMRVMAVALNGRGDSMIRKFTENMQHAEKYEFEQQTEAIKGILGREQMSAQFRIIAKAREIEDRESITLKKYSGSYPGNL